MTRRRILTWHVHGSYLYYLAQGDRHDYILPTRPGQPSGYGGRNGGFSWPDNVHEVAAEDVRRLDIDAVLVQARPHYLVDMHQLLSPEQLRLPRIYLEHDPPREHPTDTRHPAADDPATLLVHCTHFNALMWNSGGTATRVVPHGVTVPNDLDYRGERERGLVVVNGLGERGRRLGLDVFQHVREQMPLDLVGMGSEALGGLGALPLDALHATAIEYRFVFNPIRYTSLGLAVCEAMMLGIPVVGLATTELPTVITSGVSGYADTDVDRLIDAMQRLLRDPAHARAIAARGREVARERFNITRFLDDWDDAWGQTEQISTAADHVGLSPQHEKGA